MALVLALLLGLRHATDPDHLTAVSTLVLTGTRQGARRASLLGLFWGLGHGTTLFGFALPIVFFQRYLPDPIQRIAEVTIGAVIAALAVRLLVRWRRGYFHVHPHSHGSTRHAHPHAHEGAHHSPGAHRHHHAEALGRSPLASFAIGCVHGIGGSAGTGVLLVSAVPDRGQAVVGLAFFAAGTALSMGLISSAFGLALTQASVARRLTRLVPAFGTGSLLFGIWYSVGALRGPM